MNKQTNKIRSGSVKYLDLDNYKVKAWNVSPSFLYCILRDNPHNSGVL